MVECIRLIVNDGQIRVNDFCVFVFFGEKTENLKSVY